MMTFSGPNDPGVPSPTTATQLISEIEPKKIPTLAALNEPTKSLPDERKLTDPPITTATNKFSITATVIPIKLLETNYGPMPKGIEGLDINACNSTNEKPYLLSGQVYQVLLDNQQALQPVGDNIMFAAIVQNQNHNLKSWLSMALTATTGTLSVLGTSSTAHISSGLTSGLAVGSLIGQALLTSFNPALTANQLQNFHENVLQSQTVVASDSCVEKTVFVVNTLYPKPASPFNNLCLWLQIK